MVYGGAMRRRVFVIAGEYSANPRHLPPSRRGRAFLAQPHPELTREEVTRLEALGRSLSPFFNRNSVGSKP